MNEILQGVIRHHLETTSVSIVSYFPARRLLLLLEVLKDPSSLLLIFLPNHLNQELLSRKGFNAFQRGKEF